MSINSKSEFMISGDVLSVLMSLIIPMSVGMFALLVINLVDAFYIGKLGVLPLSAISFAFPVLFTIMSFNIGIAIGASASISKFIGQRNLYKAKITVTNIFILIFALMCFVSLLCFLFNSQIFILFGADGNTLILIQSYMSTWYIGSPFFACLVIGNSILRANGDSLTPSLIIIATSAINAILDPILIFGLGPIDPIGIKGAAIATTISYIIGMNLMITSISNAGLLSYPDRSLNALIKTCFPILIIGLPAAFAMMLNPIVLGYINKLVSSHGSEAVAAFGVGLRIESLATVGIIAISSSLTPFIGQNLGANKLDRINKAINYSVLLSAIWGLAVAVPLIIFNKQFSSLFTSDITVQNFLINYLKIISLSYIFWGWANIASATFNGYQKPSYATIIFLSRLFIITIPFVIIGNILYGLFGIFLGIALSNIASGILSIIFTKFTTVLYK